MRHDIEWVTAPPLWALAQADGGSRARFRQPPLLRFERDTFMDDLIGVLDRGDGSLGGYVARPETWEAPEAGWVAAEDSSLADPLRLYQPAHGRFYVTAGALICRRVGLPIRKVKASAGERASILVRRLVAKPDRALDLGDPTSFVEQAWIGDRKAGQWKPVTGVIADGEERLPMFPLTAAGDDGRKRQIWAGMVPVASREIYEGARPDNAPTAPPPPGTATPADPLEDASDPRRATFLARVMQGFEGLLDSPPSSAAAADEDKAAPYMRESLSLTLLDLVDFLQAELPAIWKAIDDPATSGPLSGPELAVYNKLGAIFSGATTWRDALDAAEAYRPVLLGTGTAPGPAPVPSSFELPEIRAAIVNLIHGGGFQNAVFDALGSAPVTNLPAPGGAPVAAAQAADVDEADGGLYWLRYVYERPVCAPFHDPIVSEPSRPFRLAGFFDPNAPARPLVIRMPLDTSPAGLRRFPKGVAMLMSNKLRQQVERVKNQKLKDLDEGKIGDEPSWELGMICSLSIPIITLCAFIVLMIFLQLLNIVFWWLPFFKICLPIPVRSK